VEKIVLFGSYVTEKQTGDSDIDLFVLLNTRKKGIDRYAMASEVVEPRKIPMAHLFHRYPVDCQGAVAPDSQGCPDRGHRADGVPRSL
jgi:predicted nucleotidyltransferase